jgi:hypothetical protein
LCIPFFVGLYQGLQLLGYVNGNQAFSELSAGALRQIKYSAVTISALMVAGIAALMVLSRGKGEDITGIVAPGILITFLSSVVATVAALFQKRVQQAIDLRSEKGT